MAEKSIISNSKLNAIADAIVTKGGGTAPMTADQMAAAIANIPAGGIDIIDGNLEITSLSLPHSRIRANVFMGCNMLQSIEFTAEEVYFGSEMCRSLTNLQSVTAPNATRIHGVGNEFNYCQGLTNIDLPIDYLSSTFSDCSGLISFVDRFVHPNGFKTQIQSAALSGCTHLVTIDFYNGVSIGPWTISGCTALTNLVLRHNSVSELQATAAFAGSTKFNDKTASIWVPDGLVESYKAATNWSTYADIIKPLSEYVEA